MSKNKYRAQNVKSVNQEKLAELVRDKDIIFGHDVAKESLYGVFMDKKTGQLLKIISWKHPFQTTFTLDMILSLPWSTFEVVLESSGTYGDSIRDQFSLRGIPLFRVSAKHSHDSHELYDGVPSSHDAKSSAVIAELHRWGKSHPWIEATEDQKTLRAATRIYDLHHDTYYRYLNKLEGLLARHWPEALALFDLKSVSLAELVKTYGSPQAVWSHANEARTLMKKTGGSNLKSAKIEKLIESAHNTLGVTPNEQERKMLCELADEIRELYKKKQKAKKKVEQLSQDNVEVERMSGVVGTASAAVFYTATGPVENFTCAHAYLKTMGLNLKERSSGKYKGQLKITKRGSSTCRRYLYLAALRLIKNDTLVRRWYNKKVKRDGGLKMKAIIAVMRKLAKALWHVGQGAEFCSSLLFDPSKLKPPQKPHLIGN